MKVHKKSFALGLSLVLAGFLTVGCSSDNDNGSEPDDTVQNSTVVEDLSLIHI